MKKLSIGLLVALAGSGLLLTGGCGGGDDNEGTTTIVTNTVNNTTVVTNNVPTPVALDAPSLVSPANNSSFNHFPRTVVFVWAPVAGADKYVLDWEIQNPATLVWTTNWSVSEVNGTTKTINFTGMQPGRWRVRAKKNDGTEGPWSAWSTFKFTV